MEILVAIDALDDLVSTARPVPLRDQVRLDPNDLNQAVERLRSAVTAEFGLLPGNELEGVTAIETLAAAAKPVPLASAVRIDREAVLKELDELRLELRKAIAAKRGVPYEAPPWAETLVTIDELDDLILNARVVPLTDQVRLERADLEACVATLREQVAGNRRAAAVVERVGAVVAAAKPVPLTDQIRVHKYRFYELLDELRVVIVDDPPSGGAG